MKQIGTTTEGALIVELTQEDLRRIDNLISTVNTAQQTLVGIFRIPQAIMPPPADDDAVTTARTPADPTQVEKPQPRLKKRAVAKKAKAKAKPANGTAKGQARKDWKSGVIDVMVGKGDMPVKAIVEAYANAFSGGVVTPDVSKAIGQCLPSNKDVFERAGYGVYRLRDQQAVPTPAPAPVASKPKPQQSAPVDRVKLLQEADKRVRDRINGDADGEV